MEGKLARQTRQSSCGKPQEAYQPHRNLLKHNMSWGEGTPSCPGCTRPGGGGGTPSCNRPGGTPPCLEQGEGTPSSPVKGGYPILSWSEYPLAGTAPLPRRYLRPLEVLWAEDGVPWKGHVTSGSIMGWRLGIPRCEHTENITFILNQTTFRKPPSTGTIFTVEAINLLTRYSLASR